jgi:hypothetical protein
VIAGSEIRRRLQAAEQVEQFRSQGDVDQAVLNKVRSGR